LFNEAHKILIQQETEQNLLIDPLTGNYPYLQTYEGFYVANPPTVLELEFWRIHAILIDNDTELEGDNWRTEAFSINGMDYLRVLNTKAYDAVYNTPAAVVFNGVSPGTTTDVFRVLGYFKAREIVSDSIEHMMIGTTDMELLVPATIKLIEGLDHGNYEEARQQIIRDLKPQMRYEMNHGATGQSNYCTKRAY
jgi:hypothetical protein